MNVDLWHLSGQGFHFGKHGLGQEDTTVHWPSDSLWAALMTRIAEQQGGAAVQKLADALNSDQPPAAFSSLFPRVGEVLFFPKPLLLPKGEPSPDEPRPKDIKKMKWVSQALFTQLVNGQSLGAVLAQAEKWHDGAVVLTAKEHQQLPAEFVDWATKPAPPRYKIWSKEKRPRVAVGRADGGSQIYFTGRVTFAPQAGLWFAVRWFDETFKPMLESALCDLSVTGFGGERAAGFGAGRLERNGTLDLPAHNNSRWVTLSRYLPRKDEMSALTHPQAAYQLETVGGWITSAQDSNQRRRAVRLVAEGAVLGDVTRVVPGRAVDTQPKYGDEANPTYPLSHPVWRCGVALAVGVKEA